MVVGDGGSPEMVVVDDGGWKFLIYEKLEKVHVLLKRKVKERELHAR